MTKLLAGTREIDVPESVPIQAHGFDGQHNPIDIPLGNTRATGCLLEDRLDGRIVSEDTQRLSAFLVRSMSFRFVDVADGSRYASTGLDLVLEQTDGSLQLCETANLATIIPEEDLDLNVKFDGITIKDLLGYATNWVSVENPNGTIVHDDESERKILGIVSEDYLDSIGTPNGFRISAVRVNSFRRDRTLVKRRPIEGEYFWEGEIEYASTDGDISNRVEPRRFKGRITEADLKLDANFATKYGIPLDGHEGAKKNRDVVGAVGSGSSISSETADRPKRVPRKRNSRKYLWGIAAGIALVGSLVAGSYWFVNGTGMTPEGEKAYIAARAAFDKKDYVSAIRDTNVACDQISFRRSIANLFSTPEEELRDMALQAKRKLDAPKKTELVVVRARTESVPAAESLKVDQPVAVSGSTDAEAIDDLVGDGEAPSVGRRSAEAPPIVRSEDRISETDLFRDLGTDPYDARLHIFEYLVRPGDSAGEISNLFDRTHSGYENTGWINVVDGETREPLKNIRADETITFLAREIVIGEESGSGSSLGSGSGSVIPDEDPGSEAYRPQFRPGIRLLTDRKLDSLYETYTEKGAKNLGTGTVRFGVQIDKNGAVIDIRVMEATGEGSTFGRYVLNELRGDVKKGRWVYTDAQDGIYFTETLKFGGAE